MIPRVTFETPASRVLVKSHCVAFSCGEHAPELLEVCELDFVSFRLSVFHAWISTAGRHAMAKLDRESIKLVGSQPIFPRTKARQSTDSAGTAQPSQASHLLTNLRQPNDQQFRLHRLGTQPGMWDLESNPRPGLANQSSSGAAYGHWGKMSQLISRDPSAFWKRGSPSRRWLAPAGAAGQAKR